MQDFSEHVPVLEKSITNIMMAIANVLYLNYLQDINSIDAKFLAICVVKEMFFDQSFEGAEITYYERNLDLVKEKVKDAFKNEEIRRGVSFAYAGSIMLLGWQTRNPLNEGIQRLVEQATKYHLEVVNINKMWGEKAIINLYQFSESFLQKNGNENDLDNKKDDEKIIKYASVFSYLILDNVCLVLSVLFKQPICKSFVKEDWNTTTREILFYNMSFCGRLIYGWQGENRGEIIVDNIFSQIGTTIDQNRDKLLAEKFDLLSMENFSGYLATLRNGLESEALRDLYNQREAEYHQYDLIRDPGAGKAGLLDWEFAEKLSGLLNRAKEPVLLMSLNMAALTCNKRLIEAVNALNEDK